MLDVWFTGDWQDWYAWSIEQMTEADFIIVVASPRYRQLGDGARPGKRHKGVQSEAALLREFVYADRGCRLPRILPVILPGHGIDEVPMFLQPHTASHYLVPALTVAGTSELLRVILRQPGHVPPPVAYGRPVLPVLSGPGAGPDWLLEECQAQFPNKLAVDVLDQEIVRVADALGRARFPGCASRAGSGLGARRTGTPAGYL